MVTFQQQPDNPFGLIRVSSDISPTFADIDADGDLDVFIGERGGNTVFFRNTGSSTSPSFGTSQVNPFGFRSVGSDSHPTFVDINADGDLDAFIGERGGNTFFFENLGTARNPVFTPSRIAPNPFNLTNVGGLSTPTFADIDGDRDLDAFIGNLQGNTVFFQNTGSPTRPSFFNNPQTNPFGLSDVGLDSNPIFADIDKDGDLDAFIGNEDGNTLFFQNTGSSTSPNFATPQANPFGLANVGGFSSPTFADIDADRDLDAFIGDVVGNINFFLNTISVGGTLPLSGAGERKQFAFASGDGTININDFGGVGRGVKPAVAVIAEVDTLQFTGAGLTPENLLLTQKNEGVFGNNLELSFEGVAGTKVVLGNFALEDLDNLTKATGAAVNLGGILFDGQTVIEDSFDVFNADWQREQIFNRNSVTFLNHLDNTIQGFDDSDDVINAQAGNDRIYGRGGNDLLRGGEGWDKLIGGKGNDTLVGNDGVDRLRGGKGDDLLNGGRGNDLFVLAAKVGTDTVQDFDNGSDRFGLAGGLTFGQLTISQSNSNTLIKISATNEVLASLTGVNANLIGVEDFIVG